MLDPADLTDAIRRISDPTHPDHAWPADPDEATDRWAAAITGYLAGRILPRLPGADLAVLLASREAFAEALPAGGVQALQAAVTVAVAVGAALLPPPAVAAPPAAPLALPVAPPSADASGAAERLAMAIHAWVLTATWTPGLPVAPAPWA